MLVFKLILRRVWMALCEEFLYRLRYVAGFALFALILWLLKVVILEQIDTRYWDSIKSDQFKSFQDQNEPSRPEIRGQPK